MLPTSCFTYHTQFFIHKQSSTRLTQALCLTLFFFRLLSSVSPPRSSGREHSSLTYLNIQLEEEKCIAWTFLFWTMALDNPLWGFGSLSMFYLCFFKNNVLKTDYEVLCYVFGKDVVVTRIWLYEIKFVVLPLFTNMCSYNCLVYLWLVLINLHQN